MVISACMIAKNEENNIAKCIDSYKDAVDEIIVVDTGSSDHTVDIAKSLGAAVYSYEWDNDFAKAKNFACGKAKGDWIVFLDADEYFDKQSIQSMRKTLEQYLSQDDAHCISCRIFNIDADNGNKLIVESINVRIIRNIAGLCYVGRIHEDFRFNGEIPKIKFEQSFVVYHTGYSSRISRQKTRRNLEILKSIQNKNSADSSKYDFYLAQTYRNLEEYEKAIRHITRFLESGIEFIGNVTMPYEIFFCAMIETGNFSGEYDKWLDIGKKRFPHHPLFLCCRAYKHLHNKEYAKALHYFKEGIALNKNYNVASQVNLINKNIDTIYYYIGDIYEKMNLKADAADYYVKCLNHNKYNAYAFKRLLLLKHLRSDDITGILNGIYEKEEKQDMQFLMKQLSSLRIGPVLSYYWNIWHKNYGYHAAYYVMTLLAAGRYQEAFDILYKAARQCRQNNENLSNLEPYLIVSAIFSPNTAYIEKAIQIVSPSYQKIIKLIIGAEKGYVSDAEFSEYYNILREIAALTEEEVVKVFLSVKKRFSMENSNRLCDLLNERGLTTLALECYQAFADQADVQTKIGICYYMLSQWDRATEHLNNALGMGYHEPDAYEYLNWIKEYGN